MKKTLNIITALLLTISGFAQKPCEDRIDSVKITTLRKAQLMSELIKEYPRAEYNEMITYVSVEISTLNQ